MTTLFEMKIFNFLEARAEILKNLRWFFGRPEDTKKTFQNQLTFSDVSLNNTLA